MNIGKTNMKVGGKDFWLMVALGAVIIAAIVIVILSFTKSDHRPLAGALVFRFQCQSESCKHEFTVNLDEEAKVAAAAREAGNPLPLDAGRPPALPRTCPKCGTQDSAMMQKQCPNCQTGFVPDSSLSNAAYGTGVPQEICPNCKTDIVEWYRQHPDK